MSLQAITPMLTVSDISRSVAFYRDILGFTVVHGMTTEQGEPCWAYLKNGAVELMLGVPVGDSTASPSPAGVSLFLNVDEAVDIDAFYEQVKASGATIAMEIRDESWGDRIFAVKDPDGYESQIGKTMNEPNFEGVPIFQGETANDLFLQPAT